MYVCDVIWQSIETLSVSLTLKVTGKSSFSSFPLLTIVYLLPLQDIGTKINKSLYNQL